VSQRLSPPLTNVEHHSIVRSPRMDLGQSDRDLLRESQYKLNSTSVIGKIVEHRSQDPKQYKLISRGGQLKSEEKPDVPKILYENKHFNQAKVDPPSAIGDESDLPITTKDVQSNLWLNMDQIEFDKLEWMSDKAEQSKLESMKSTAKFDKDGRVISSQAKGVEAHDLETLVTLLDSAYPPQVTYALNVVSKIAVLATMGYYDRTFDENIHEVLLRKCVLRVRHKLDHSNETICQSALKCLRALLCNTQVDEVILDRIHPLISEQCDSNQWLFTEDMNSNFTIDMKDIECVELDVIWALIVRTELLKRFACLLQSNSSVHLYSDCILDILIRVARHSTAVCYLLDRNELFDIIIGKFLPLSIVNKDLKSQLLCARALKLARISARALLELDIRQQKSPAHTAIEAKLSNIVPIIEAYFFIDCYSLASGEMDQLMKIHIETLRLMKTLSQLKSFQASMISLMAMGRDKIFSSFKTLATLDVRKHLDSRVSFDWQYAAHLIDLTGFSMRYEKYHRTDAFTDSIWLNFIKPLILQWLTDSIRSKEIPHFDVSVTIASAVYHYRYRVNGQERKLLNEVMIDSIIEERKDKRVTLDFFKLLVRSASDNSQLPSFSKDCGRKRDPRGLPSFGCLAFNSSTEYNYKLSPLFDTRSPYILLETFTCQLLQEKARKSESLGIFVDNLDLNRYIKTLTGYHKLSKSYESLVQQSLIAQYEVRLICRSILLMGRYYLNFDAEEGEPVDIEPSALKFHRSESYGNLCYITISALGLLYADTEDVIALKDQLFENLLFNYRLQMRLSREVFEKTSSIDQQVSVQMNPISGDSNFERLNNYHLQLLLPIYMSCDQPNRYWILQPIQEYYFDTIREGSKNQSGALWFQQNMNWRLHTAELASSDDYAIVSVVLEFNYTMMLHSTPYIQLIIRPDLDDYLCLLACLFLHDDMFLDERVSKALASNIRHTLCECVKEIDGKMRIPFVDASHIIKPLDLPLADFFNKLVDQFESVSYGNIAFANLILLFVAPGSDKTFKRRLFNEKAETCLCQLKLKIDEVWAPNEIFFSTKETDPEIKDLLKRSGAYIQSGSFLHHYRSHHM